MATKINVSKTITIASDVFAHLANIVEGTDVSFSSELNSLCRDGMEARKAAAAARNPPGGDDGE